MSIASSRAILSSVVGWVEKSLASPEPYAAYGFTCASGATAGETSIGMRRA